MNVESAITTSASRLAKIAPPRASCAVDVVIFVIRWNVHVLTVRHDTEITAGIDPKDLSDSSSSVYVPPGQFGAVGSTVGVAQTDGDCGGLRVGSPEAKPDFVGGHVYEPGGQAPASTSNDRRVAVLFWKFPVKPAIDNPEVETAKSK
jgi:hypothetical protein